MNWTIIDHTTKAIEIPGAGCFVMFFSKDICFAPGTTLKKDTSNNNYSIVAAPVCGTHITFTADGTTSTTDWVGDGGVALDAKLRALEARGPAQIDLKKLGKLKVKATKKKKK